MDPHLGIPKKPGPACTEPLLSGGYKELWLCAGYMQEKILMRYTAGPTDMIASRKHLMQWHFRQNKGKLGAKAFEATGRIGGIPKHPGCIKGKGT